MQEARFQVRYNGKSGVWESISFVAIMVGDSEQADSIARGMAMVPGVKEVRFTFAGSRQGYYRDGGN